MLKEWASDRIHLATIFSKSLPQHSRRLMGGKL